MKAWRDSLKIATSMAAGVGFSGIFPESMERAFAIDPVPGSSYLDAEHVVILMQENRSFDHMLGALQGVRGFNDPRAVTLPDENLVWPRLRVFLSRLPRKLRTSITIRCFPIPYATGKGVRPSCALPYELYASENFCS
jgi:hypothetical protein